MNIRHAPGLLRETYNEWSADKGPRLGAALAYYAVFSIPPLMMIALAVLGFIYSDNIDSRLESQLATLVGADTAKTLLIGVELKGNTGGIVASLVGLGILLFGASGVFAELQDALNTIWGVKRKDEGLKGLLKGLLKGRFTSFTMVLGICFLLLVSLIMSSVVAAMSEQLGLLVSGGKTIGMLLDIATSFGVITLLFAMIFKLLPDVRIHWSDVWMGAVVTAALFTVGKLVIGTYIGQAGIGSAYGAAGSIVILVTWIYYSAQILYFGAEFTQVYASRRGSHFVPKPNAESLPEPGQPAQPAQPESSPKDSRQIRPAQGVQS